ncbi:DEAD/DEAH box helicase family protein, partial [Vibrio parahaemolyticus V-223/04]
IRFLPYCQRRNRHCYFLLLSLRKSQRWLSTYLTIPLKFSYRVQKPALWCSACLVSIKVKRRRYSHI